MNIISWVKPYLKVSQIKSGSRKCRILIRLHKKRDIEIESKTERENGNPELALYRSNV